MARWVWDTLHKLYLGMTGGLTVLFFNIYMKEKEQLIWLWLIFLVAGFMFNYYAHHSD